VCKPWKEGGVPMTDRQVDWARVCGWVGVLGLNMLAWYAIAWGVGTALGLGR
jgi:hypothetical protein